MHEVPPPPRWAHETRPTPDVSQMAHDLWEFDPTGESYESRRNLEGVELAKKYPQESADTFRDGDLYTPGVMGYGYPDPVLTVRAQEEAAHERGEEPPLTPERMARDIYLYEVDRRKADVRYSFPSFQERYGYPDPRPRPPEDEQPSA